MVGAGTAAADNPSLTCRLPGLVDASPIRVVVDGRLRLPLTHTLVTTARTVPTWILTRSGNSDRRRAFADAGVELIDLPSRADGMLDLDAGLAVLGTRGVTRLLVEGGGKIQRVVPEDAPFRDRLAREQRRYVHTVDRLVWFRAPSVIGGDGIPVCAGFGVDALDEAPKFVKVSARAAGRDVVETYVRDR